MQGPGSPCSPFLAFSLPSSLLSGGQSVGGVPVSVDPLADRESPPDRREPGWRPVQHGPRLPALRPLAALTSPRCPGQRGFMSRLRSAMPFPGQCGGLQSDERYSPPLALTCGHTW